MAPATLAPPDEPFVEPGIPAVAPEDIAHYEIVNGQHVELPPMGHRAARIATGLAVRVQLHCETHEGGWCVTESKFRIAAPGDPGRVRKPDFAFVSFDRWPADQDEGAGDVWEIVPDLVAEVASPTDTLRGLLAKAREYFAAGVRRVWIIEPEEGFALEHDGPTDSRTLRLNDSLDGGDVLPGFSLRLGDLLGPPLPAAR